MMVADLLVQFDAAGTPGDGGVCFISANRTHLNDCAVPARWVFSEEA
jgi:hypothetical protein